MRMAMADSKSSSKDTMLKIASKLSDVTESFEWYSLQIPELANLQPRVGHALVSLSDHKVLMIGGGNHNGALNELITINLEPESEKEETVMSHPASECFPSRYEFLCAKDSSKNCAWVFGGADPENTSNEIIKIDEDTIEILKCNENSDEESWPCPRTQGNNSAIVEYNGSTFIAVFAGGLKGENPVQDQELHLFDTFNRKWQKVNVQADASLADLPFASKPPLVQGQIMTAIGSKVIVHGGINGTSIYDGFHWIDLEKENQENSSFSWINSRVADTSTEIPSGRAAHAVARLMDVRKGSPLCYMFGGMGEKGECNDLWKLNADSMSWTRILKNCGKESSNFYPVPRLDLAMCAISLHNEIMIMIHGGMNREGEIFNDAWIMKVE